MTELPELLVADVARLQANQGLELSIRLAITNVPNRTALWDSSDQF